MQSTTLLVTSGNPSPMPASPRDLVMAWAVDCDTGKPRYILQLDAEHRGNKSNCKCPGCDLPLQSVNVAKTEFIKRPHFRHPEGAAREHCIIIAARKAFEALFLQQDQIVLPRLRRSRNFEGLSGQYYDAWVEQSPERVQLADCQFRDETTAMLTLDDGRQLLVRLVGRGDVSALDGDDVLHARIDLDIDDPAIAMMSPEEIFARLELAWSSACWRRHWKDAELDHQAEAMARESAAKALDWLDDADLPKGLGARERRETLLHREVKTILECEKRICLPGLYVEAKYHRKDHFIDRRSWSSPDVEVSLSAVHLEVPLGHSRPDVLIEWIDEETSWSCTALVEVTVTNPITDERIDRLSSYGWPVLEIDIGRMGGVVTREELTRLVVDEVAGKRWLYHPILQEQKQSLIVNMQIEADVVERARLKRKALQDVPSNEWGQRYLDAFRQRWLEQLKVYSGGDRHALDESQRLTTEAIEALTIHGYLEAPDAEREPLRTIISRILSVRLGTGVEYKYDNAWSVINAILCDLGSRSLRWHTLYLIAVRAYDPTLTDTQRNKVETWRNEVTTSIRNGAQLYVRDTTYDRLLGLLFPEMRHGLNHSFGTPRYIAKQG